MTTEPDATRYEDVKKKPILPDRVLLIAEAGVNHNGDPDVAFEMIDAAAAAGADCVKFQTFIAEHGVSAKAAKADYQKRTTGEDESQLDMVKKLELPFETHARLKSYCDAKGIIYLSTPFDPPSTDFLHGLGIGLWKIPSGEITNYPHLQKIASYGEPILMSTGMSDMDEISAALRVLKDNGAPQGGITLLQCTTEYPAPFSDVNLRAMRTMSDAFGLPVGYSDHTQGIEAAIAAVALGASVIEKHFTLDRNMPGPDHRASLEPDELKAMVQAIRHVEQAMGDGQKTAAPSEQKNRDIARKSIVAAHPIRKGDILNEENLAVKRPGTGMSPMRWNGLIGRTADSDYDKDEQIRDSALTGAPARSAPARSTPARSTPARSAPARSAPAQSAPAQSDDTPTRDKDTETK